MAARPSLVILSTMPWSLRLLLSRFSRFSAFASCAFVSKRSNSEPKMKFSKQRKISNIKKSLSTMSLQVKSQLVRKNWLKSYKNWMQSSEAKIKRKLRRVKETIEAQIRLPINIQVLVIREAYLISIQVLTTQITFQSMHRTTSSTLICYQTTTTQMPRWLRIQKVLLALCQDPITDLNEL